MKKKFEELKPGELISYVYRDYDNNEIYVDMMTVDSVTFKETCVNFGTTVISTNSPHIQIGLEEAHCVPRKNFDTSESGNLLFSIDDADINKKVLTLKSELFKSYNLRCRSLYKKKNGLSFLS